MVYSKVVTLKMAHQVMYNSEKRLSLQMQTKEGMNVTLEANVADLKELGLSVDDLLNGKQGTLTLVFK
jgi:hypothetical protein